MIQTLQLPGMILRRLSLETKMIQNHAVEISWRAPGSFLEFASSNHFDGFTL